MPRYKRDNPKPQDKRFVSEYIRHGNGTKAAVAAYTDNRSSASSIASHKLRQPDIQALIRVALEDEQLDPRYVIHNRKTIIEQGMSDLRNQVISPADISKNLDALEKLMGLTGSREQFQSHIHLYNAPTEHVIDYRTKQTKYFTDIEKS